MPSGTERSPCIQVRRDEGEGCAEGLGNRLWVAPGRGAEWRMRGVEATKMEKCAGASASGTQSSQGERLTCARARTADTSRGVREELGR